MTDDTPGWLVDLHGATALYAAAQALLGISARATDLLWSELPQARTLVDVAFGYGLALLLVAAHVALRWRMRLGLALACGSLALLVSVCASQLLAGALSLPSYAVYEGAPHVTLAAAAAVLIGLTRQRS